MAGKAPLFFVPYTDDTEEAELSWQAVKNFMESQGFTVKERRIYSISYKQGKEHYRDEIGKKDRYGTEEILFLFDAVTVYLCCTPRRGVIEGSPILIGRDTAKVVEFQPAQAS